MIAKKASFKFTDINPLIKEKENGNRMMRTASGRVVIETGSDKARVVESEIKKHPNALFFRAKAIEANCPNSNGDYFSTEELKASYKSFEGVPFFTNHDNQNVENARGKVIFAEWIPEEEAVYTICFIDRDAYPHICRSIEEEYVTGVSMGSLNGSAKVLMHDLSEKPIEDVSIGDKVITPYGNVCEVVNKHCEVIDSPMYKFEFRNYHKSSLYSPNHPILVIDGEDIIAQKNKSIKEAQANKYQRRKNKTDRFVGQDGWRDYEFNPKFIEAQEVKENDFFLIPSKFKLAEESQIEFDEDLYYLMGAYLGDGYVHHYASKNANDRLAYYIGLHEKDSLGKNIIDKLNLLNPVNKVTTQIFENKGGMSITVHDSRLADLMVGNYKKLAHQKRIVKREFSASQIRNLIAGYIDTDGCVVKTYTKKQDGSIRGNGIRGVQISSCNDGLLEDIQSLLILLDVPTYIKNSYRPVQENSVVSVPTIEYTLFIPYGHLDNFKNSLKVNNVDIKEPEIMAGKTFIVSLNGNKYMACPVTAIDIVEFPEPTYDLTVEEDECYIADGLAVHNCSVEYSCCNICGNRAERTEDYCFVPGTPIVMSDLSIKNIEDVIVGDEVLDAFGLPTKVVELFTHDVDEIMQKITSKAINGELICTPNHPFLVERRNALKFVPCGYLQEKETLLTPIAQITVDDSLFDIFDKYSIANSEVNRLKISKLIGYFIAEGCVLRHADRGDIGIELCFHKDETDYIDEIVNICVDIIGKTPEIIDRSYNDRHKDRVSNSKQIRIYNSFIVDIINASCVGLAKQKTLSKKVLSLSKPYLQEVLAGYIDGDGYSDKYGRLILTTASRNLAHQIMYICNMFGIPPSIYSYLQNGGPNNRDDVSCEIFKVSVANLQTLPLNNSSIKSQKCKSIAKTNVNISRLKNAFSTDGFVRHCSYSIEELPYRGTVYNFETESNSYVANNTAVHNCTHIRNRKGRKFTGRARNVVTGEEKDFRDETVFEYNHGLKFIELSAVVDPACPSCHIQGIIPNEDYMSKVAKMENEFRMVRTAAIEKKASQEEVDQIEQCLTTLEQIAVSLIQNRKQVEMEFSSDLVQIMSDLQTWLEELIGAGYGNLESGAGVPGTVGNVEENAGVPAAEPPMPQGAPPQGMPAPTPVASETEANVGSVSGSPLTPSTSAPRLPITAPVKPRTSNVSDSRSIQRISDIIVEKNGNDSKCMVNKRIANGQKIIRNAFDICEKLNKIGDVEMGARRTVAEKQQQKEQVIKILSNSWKEKQSFFEYIKQVPSIQNNEHRLSVNKRDDSFIIVAEDKSSDATKVWTYEDLTDDERNNIMESPQDAAIKLLENFANNLNKQKEGVKKMSDISKKAGAATVQGTPDRVQEAQLDRSDIYHPRTNSDTHSTIQKQLDSKRNGGDPEILTEKQLNDGIKHHPRTNTEIDRVQENQLDSLRENSDLHSTTQKQLDGFRSNNEPNTLTENQLNSTAAPWARAAKRDASQFKSASDHMKSVLSVLASSAIKTGCTPHEACTVAASLVDSLENRYNLGVSLVEGTKAKEDINYAKRVAYWQNKNLKVASVGTKEIAEVIVDGLRSFASDETYNPDVLIDAVDVVSEGQDGIDSVSSEIEVQLASSRETAVVKSSRKDELRAALQSKKNTVEAAKKSRDLERKKLTASIKDEKANILNPKSIGAADTVIETSFEELGAKRTDAGFKKEIVAFTKGALASQNLRLASITNVTISGDTIQIAVQTGTEENEVNIDTGSGTTEIPIGGETAMPEGDVPEGDMSGEGMESTLGGGQQQSWASSKKGNKMRRSAQAPMGGGVGGSPAGAAPEQGLPGGAPMGGDPIQALTTDTAEEPVDAGMDEDAEIPTDGERQMPWTVCPECGSTDVDVTNEAGNIKGKCNNCTAEYEALIKKTVEFKIIKPTKSVGEEGVESPEAPEAPEVPALPVAAQTNLGKDAIVRIANNKKTHGHVCPACGASHRKASVEENGHAEFVCDNCGTPVEKDFMVSASNPEVGVLRVKWDIFPDVGNCEGCKESVAKFASDVKIAKMLKTAAAKADEFPMSACMERLARTYGGNTVATFGECKGKVMAECVCGQLKKLGFRKIRQMNRIAAISLEKDPWDECIEDQTKKEGHNLKEAEALCNCIKKRFASELNDNVYVQAFKEDIEKGLEKDLTVTDLISLDDALKAEKLAKAKMKQMKKAAAEEADIGSATLVPPAKFADVEVEIEEEVVEAKAKEDFIVVEAEAKEDCVEVEVDEDDDKKDCDKDDKDCDKDEDKCLEKEASIDEAKEKQIALAMNGRRVRHTNEEVFKMASSPKKVDSIEGNVEAGVPRSKATIRNEGADNIDVPMAKPSVPRGNAEMGHEGADNINPATKTLDIPVGNSYMGHEQEMQSGMPAINNQIKGTVIANIADDIAGKIAKASGGSKETILAVLRKEAKQLKEVDSIDGNVEVPRSKATIGNEGADNIDVPMAKPSVPRGNAEMGNEGADNINPATKTLDIPMDNAYMGAEKEMQKDMPGINSDMLKTVQQKRQNQLDKISQARKNEAVQAAAWLVANNRIDSDKTTFDNVVTALMSFEADNISVVASSMFPEKTVRKASAKTEASEGYSIPAIVQQSTQSGGDDLQTRLASSFTIGNSKFDKALTMYGDK